MSDKAEGKSPNVAEESAAETMQEQQENMMDPENESETSGQRMDDSQDYAADDVVDSDDDSTGDSKQSVQVDADELVQLRGDVQRFRDLAMRTTADLENYRKRMTREKEEAVRYANLKLLEDLLPVLDNFELGLQAAEKSSDQGVLLQGMQMVNKQIHSFLERNGVERLNAVGEQFDPRYHEAMSKEPSTEVEEGRVIRQTRNGYQMGDRLLRAANVVVSSGPPADS